MKLERLNGTWSLVAFDIVSPGGKRTPWGKNAHGLLLYTPSGHMSVSINKDVETSGDGEASDIFDSILFYSGTYQVEGSVIRHQVTQASNPARIGKELIRHATLTSDHLELATPAESFGTAILVWRRVEP